MWGSVGRIVFLGFDPIYRLRWVEGYAFPALFDLPVGMLVRSFSGNRVM